jgi:hypothetical protein
MPGNEFRVGDSRPALGERPVIHHDQRLADSDDRRTVAAGLHPQVLGADLRRAGREHLRRRLWIDGLSVYGRKEKCVYG